MHGISCGNDTQTNLASYYDVLLVEGSSKYYVNGWFDLTYTELGF